MRRVVHRLRLPEERMTTSTTSLTLGDGARRRRAARARVRRDVDDGRARRARGARLAPDAPRLRLRDRTQRHPGHLHEHAEPGRLVRALHHRLDRPEGPAGPHDVPHEGLGVPGRHDGLPRDGHQGRDRRHRLRLGRSRRVARCRRHGRDRRARRASRSPSTPTTTRGRAAATSGVRNGSITRQGPD